MQFLFERLQDPKFLAMIFAAVAAIATVLTLAMPLLSSDTLSKRMKSVALERDKIRQRERERLARGDKDKIALRQSPKQYMQSVVEQFNLNKWLAQEEARDKLVMAGYRGQGPYVLTRQGSSRFRAILASNGRRFLPKCAREFLS